MKKIYNLEDLDCAICAQKMEEAIKKIEGIKAVNISFIMQKMTIEYEEDINEKNINKDIKKVCKKIEPDCNIIF